MIAVTRCGINVHGVYLLRHMHHGTGMLSGAERMR